MATPIRPDFQSSTPQPTQRPDAARNAAQRAFFQAAMSNAGAPATAPVQPQVRPQASVAAQPDPARPTQRIPTHLPAEPPTRILRPGSLLDIKV